MIRALALCLILAGCSTSPPAPETIRVPVEVIKPIYVMPSAPGELSRPYTPLNIPEFVSPADKSAIVALTPEGLDHLKVILRTLVTRDKAWREWSKKELQMTDSLKSLTAEPGQ